MAFPFRFISLTEPIYRREVSPSPSKRWINVTEGEGCQWNIKGTILVAHDNEAIRDPLVEMLRAHRYRVIAVEDGERALMEICSQPVDLALLDVTMPLRTGFSVCRAVNPGRKRAWFRWC